MPSKPTVTAINDTRKAAPSQPVATARKPVPTMPLILDRILYKFERGVLLTSIAREFECAPSFIEALIRREYRRMAVEVRQMKRAA